MESYAPPSTHYIPSREIEPIPVQTSRTQLHPRQVFSRNNSISNNMSWTEQVDTLMASQSFPFSSSLHISRSPSPCPISLSPAPFSPGGSLNRIHNLEQDFCSNFSCCGLCLAGMHQLLDHFEENHVVVFDKDGRPIYPVTQDTTCSGNSKPHDHHKQCNSIIINYPSPQPPVAPGSTLSEGIGKDARLAFQAEHLSNPHRLFSDIMADFDPFDFDSSVSSSSSSSASSSALSSPVPSEPVCLPPSLLTVQPPMHHTSSDDQDMMIDVVDVTSSISSFGFQPHGDGDRKQVHIGRPPKPRVFDVAGRRAKIVDGQSPQRRRDREKAYKCPHAGCSKQYLNPNGLKYHLEKGTCTIDPAHAPEVLEQTEEIPAQA